MKFLVPLVLFGLFWTAIVGAADVMIGGSIVSSLKALTFERTTGTITHSEVIRHEDSDGDTFGVDIRYTYHVEGNRHEGTRFSYSVVSSAERMWADRIVSDHPVGATREVRYSRHQPSETVLNPGIDGSRLLMLMFLTPFNAVMVAIWSFVGLVLFQMRHKGVRSPLPTFQRHGATHVRLSHLTWPVVGVIGVGGASMVGIFLVGLGTGFHPGEDQMVVCWIIVLLIGLHVALGRRRQERAGCFDFIVDQRFVSFPQVAGEAARLQLRKSEVADIEMTLTGHDDDTPQYDILLRKRDGGAHKLVSWSGEDSSREIVAWLRLQLRGGR